MRVIPQLHVGDGTTTGSVTVFPVWSADPPVEGLVTGAEAELEVTELPDDPDVSRVMVVNHGNQPVLLLEGELIEGGWQSRSLVRDVILSPRTIGYLEVACVEQGRWDGNRQMRRNRRATPRVQRALRGLDTTRQQQVWAGVNQYQPVATSPTASLTEQLAVLDGEVDQDLTPMPGQAGVLIGVCGQPLLIELFGSPAALAAHLPALVQAARMEARTLPPAPTPGRRARRFIGRLHNVQLGVDPLVEIGDGLHVVAETDHAMLRGAALPSGRLAHLSVLNTRHPLWGTS